MLKQFFILILSSISFGGTVAQNKIGIIDINLDSLIGTMPEAIQANIEIKKFQDSLRHEYDRLQRLIDSISNSFLHEGDAPAIRKSLGRDSVIKLYQRLQNFNLFAQGLAKQKAQQLYTPIQNKFIGIIKQVAEENGYTYVLDMRDEQLRFLPFPPYDDITNLVLRKLNL